MPDANRIAAVPQVLDVTTRYCGWGTAWRSRLDFELFSCPTPIGFAKGALGVDFALSLARLTMCCRAETTVVSTGLGVPIPTHQRSLDSSLVYFWTPVLPCSFLSVCMLPRRRRAR
eukprot:4565127-Pyramimonas_sp.AAC.1